MLYVGTFAMPDAAGRSQTHNMSMKEKMAVVKKELC